MSGARSEAGFTIMEALVAVVIFASASIAMQSVFARGGFGLRVSASETRALEVARGAIGKAEFPGPSDSTRETSGETDGYSWTATVVRYEPPSGGLVSMKVQAYWVDLKLTWIDRSAPSKPRSVSLSTLKLGQVK